ncbi:LacI family DNA-binding transcriptional regulator [Paenibacillus sp. N3.4]|uniref:LacI family DNA-binding transcriptional regulator n=1 Tax=Paenibacillus sp. N3.4 TaxID=2603222 RepID=UPI0011C8F29D|nr:LacI family DNA-binding transcriptional regulator [Paenibacillus sp. N3.4]TXK85741.1 LacI family transcriptional regulator [Paenibacillus sp. N3.4]
MKVSIFDVAKRSGLSVVTVSRVINQAGTVREKNRQKVLQAMKELDYHPNAAARSLARGKTGIIGLAITTLNDSFLDAVVKEINDRLAEKGYFLALSISTEVFAVFDNSMFQEDRVDGVIMLSPVHEDDFVMELKKKKIPFVMLDNQHIHPSISSVIVDNYKGGYDATKHLIDLGHTDIAHISGSKPYLSSSERQRGFEAAMQEAGLDASWVEQGDFSITSGYQVASGWIQSGKLPSAVFAADDLTAFGVMDALKNEGYKIPRDISIVGFDDQIFSVEFHPMLTTVRQPAEKLGRQGVDILLKWIDGTAKRNVTVQLEPELIIRESTQRKLN